MRPFLLPARFNSLWRVDLVEDAAIVEVTRLHQSTIYRALLTADDSRESIS